MGSEGGFLLEPLVVTLELEFIVAIDDVNEISRQMTEDDMK